MIYVFCLFYPLHQHIEAETLQWHHNEHDGISNHQLHYCLLNHLLKVQIKENIKALRHWPLWGEFTGDRWIPTRKGPEMQKMFPFDDVIMNKITDILQIFSNAFSFSKMFVFGLKFHWSLCLSAKLTINPHWFKYWLGTDQATSHYPNQCWNN